MIETLTFVCSICAESSTDICVYCTKDTCVNHRCLRCFRCSDCCECEVPLTATEMEGPVEPLPEPVGTAAPLVAPEPQVAAVTENAVEPEVAAQPEVEPQPEPPSEAKPHQQIEPELPREVPVEAQPEIPGIAAIVLPDPIPPAPSSAVEQATTNEELIRALPELFAPEPEEPRPAPVAEHKDDEKATSDEHSDSEPDSDTK